MSYVHNEQIKQALSVEKTIIDIIHETQMQWFGHVCCLPNSNHVKIAYKEGFVEKCPKGRPLN